MPSPLSLGGLSARELSRRVGKGIGEDDVFGHAAQLAYYFFLALFPLLLFLFMMAALAMGPNSGMQASLVSYLGRVAPPDASKLIQQTVAQTFQASGGIKALFAIIGALWSASQGVVALMDTLNSAYNAKETRPWWKQRGLAIWVTIAASVLIAAGLALLGLGQAVAAHLAAGGSFGAVVKWVWAVAQWPVMAFLVLVAFGIIYYWAPNVEHPKWHWVTPGAVTALALWIIASFGLRYYLEFFNTYSRTYGALTAVIIVLLWFYVTGAAILIGGEVNSEIERASMSTAAASGARAHGKGAGTVCAWCGKRMETGLGSELEDHVVEEHADKATPAMRRDYEERNRKSA
jgi:membrane protein